MCKEEIAWLKDCLNPIRFKVNDMPIRPIIDDDQFIPYSMQIIETKNLAFI
jgi:hypothetical protein